VKPGPRAQAVLFDDAPPPGVEVGWFEGTRPGDDSRKTRRWLIAAHDVPFRVAVGIVKANTPVVLKVARTPDVGTGRDQQPGHAAPARVRSRTPR